MRKSLEHVLFWKIKCLNLSSMVLYIFSIHIFSKKKKNLRQKTQSVRMNAVPIILMADISLKKKNLVVNFATELKKFFESIFFS